ncbi:MAG: zinc ABC transporter substrate-binding protein [Oligoflexales bacterium]|nr:zinc ABC transporter substrate-binding protein [Oligoflexales bacterium]
MNFKIRSFFTSYAMMSNLFLLFFLPSQSFAAKIKLISSSPDLAWVASKIGGQQVEVQSLLSGREDPHYVDALPSFIRQVSEADIVCIVGLDLEVGWIPKVLSKSGNAAVQPGGKGYCETGKSVDVIERPEGKIDRSQGDMHADGNPHFWLGPKAMGEAGKSILTTLMNVDPVHGNVYKQNFEDFQKELAQLKTEINTMLKPLQGSKAPIVAQYHKEFSYFFHEFDISSLGSIEEKPGVPPSAGHIAKFSLTAKSKGVKIALAKPNDPDAVLRRFAELSGARVVRLSPSLIVGEISSYQELLRSIAKQLISIQTIKEEKKGS